MNDDASPKAPTNKLTMLVAVAALITVGSGFVYGRFVQRWGIPVDLAKLGTQVEAMPTVIGPWRLTDESEMSAEVIKMLACAGYINRTYANELTGESVSVAIVLGPPGTISVHTPEICYSSRSYPNRSEKRPVVLEAQGTEHTFWMQEFQSDNIAADELRVYYAWNSDGRWLAAESPRFDFAGKQALYKIQVACSVSPLDEPGSDPCDKFLQLLLADNWSVGGQAES